MAMGVAAALDALEWQEICRLPSPGDGYGHVCDQVCRPAEDVKEKLTLILEKRNRREDMLLQLHVKNLALIEEAEMEFGRG